MRRSVTIVICHHARFRDSGFDEALATEIGMRYDAEEIFATIVQCPPRTEPRVLVDVHAIGFEDTAQAGRESEGQGKRVARMHEFASMSARVQDVAKVCPGFRQNAAGPIGTDRNEVDGIRKSVETVVIDNPLAPRGADGIRLAAKDLNVMAQPRQLRRRPDQLLGIGVVRRQGVMAEADESHRRSGFVEIFVLQIMMETMIIGFEDRRIVLPPGIITWPIAFAAS